MYSDLKKLRLFFLLLLLMQSNIIIGQETDFMDGKLIDSIDKTAIPFATILIKNKAKGLITNIDGGFKIPYELQKLGDTLVISSIGFSSKDVPLTSFYKDQINLITLVRKTETLDEVILIASTKRKKKRKNAAQIVELALDKISENYSFKPFSYVGYYRDYQIKEEKYVNLNEAIMQVFDLGFGNYDLKDTQTRIYQYKKNQTFPSDTIAAKPYDYKNKKKIISNAKIGTLLGNEYTLLRLHDAIRNYDIDSYDFVNRLDLNFVQNHELKLLSDTFIDDIPLYSIGIYKTIENITVAGKVFISKGDFKIYKMQYAVYDKSKSVESEKKSIQSNDQDLGKLLFEIILEYQLHEGIMYPKYISFNNSFESLQPAKFFPIDVEINDTKSLKITFNNTPLLKDAMKKRNYKVRYKDKKMKIDSIEVKKNVAQLYLNKEEVFNSTQIRSASNFDNKNVIIKVKKIRDIYDNVVHLQEYKSYNQFREFFVQELKIDSKKPLDTLYMLKSKPIFMNQPIAPFKNLKDYWMNSPLKN